MMTGLEYSLIALFYLFGLTAVEANECSSAVPVVHDDGTYRFSSASWKMDGGGIYIYGRCISVVAPTEKLKSHWEGVLPAGIASVGRPILGGDTFLTDSDQIMEAPLYYGNSDYVIDATYLANEDEGQRSGGQEIILTNRSSQIAELIAEVGLVAMESYKSFSFLINPRDEENLSTLNFTFTTEYEGDQIEYIASGSYEPAEGYRSVELFINFGSESLTNSLDDSVGVAQISLEMLIEPGGVVFYANSNRALADFASGEVTVSDADGRELSNFSINYLIFAD